MRPLAAQDLPKMKWQRPRLDAWAFLLLLVRLDPSAKADQTFTNDTGSPFIVASPVRPKPGVSSLSRGVSPPHPAGKSSPASLGLTTGQLPAYAPVTRPDACPLLFMRGAGVFTSGSRSFAILRNRTPPHPDGDRGSRPGSPHPGGRARCDRSQERARIEETAVLFK